MPRVLLPAITQKRKAWNKGRIIGQKRPLLPKQVWAIRARLELPTTFVIWLDSPWSIWSKRIASEHGFR